MIKVQELHCTGTRTMVTISVQDLLFMIHLALPILRIGANHWLKGSPAEIEITCPFRGGPEGIPHSP